MLAAAVLAAASMTTSAANAAYTFVGFWDVDDGPSWTIVPPAYTGQDAAALLFGGLASDYTISTIDNNPLNVNSKSWVSTWGGACGGNFPCGTQVAHNAVTNSGGLYQTFGDQSAYVQDWAVGDQFRNYAFTGSAGVVPEPSTWAMMIIGFGAAGSMIRRRKVVIA